MQRHWREDYLLIHSLENMVTVVYVWKYNPDSAAEKFELVKTYTAENCQSFSAGGVEPVRPTTKRDKVREST